MALNVLHVVDSLEPDAGAPAVSLPGLVDALRSAGVESRIHAMADGGPVDHPSTGSTLDGIDLVHFHGWAVKRPDDKRAIGLAHTATAKSIPYIISPHGKLNRKPGLVERFRMMIGGGGRVVRNAAAIGALNESEEQHLRALRFNAPVVSLPFGLNFDDYDPSTTSTESLPDAPAEHLALMLGPLHPEEGLVSLLKTFAELGTLADGWSLVFAGREVGDWRPMLEAAIRRKGAENRVLFTPAPDVATQRGWLSRASLLVAPGGRGRLGISVLQAVAMGVPVIASSAVAPSGLSEVIEVCSPKSHEFKRTLRMFLEEDDESRTANAEQALEVAQANHDWTSLAGSYVRAYEEARRGTT